MIKRQSNACYSKSCENLIRISELLYVISVIQRDLYNLIIKFDLLKRRNRIINFIFYFVEQ